MIGQECIDELADYAGLKREVAAITERAMQGELDFAARFASGSRCLQGSTRKRSAAVSPSGSGPTPAPRPWSGRCGRGARAMLVSGGFTSFAEPIAEMLGFEPFAANRLLFDGRQAERHGRGPDRRRRRPSAMR